MNKQDRTLSSEGYSPFFYYLLSGLVLAAALHAVTLFFDSVSGRLDNIAMPDELQDKVVTVRFWHAMAGELGEAMKELIERFHEKHPDIHIVSVYQGSYGALSQKLIGAVMAHEPPDVSQAYPAWISYLNQDPAKAAVLCLDEFIEKDPDFRREEVFDVLLDDCRLNGRLYALPFNKSFPILYYNREIFRRAGLEAPSTWEEFAKAGRKLTIDQNGDGKPDQWGWAFNIDSWIFECVVLQMGGRLISDDQRHSYFAAPPAVKALRFFVDAAFGKKPFAYVVTGYDHQVDFIDQKVAMIITSSVSRVYMKDRLRFDYGMLPLPAGERRAAILSGTNMAIFRSSSPKRQKAAWEFIKYFTSAQATAFWSQRTSYVPVRKTALDIMKPYLERDPNARAAIDQLAYTRFEPSMPAWYECRQILNSYLEKTFTTGGNVVENLKAAAREIDNKLSTRKAD